VGRPFGAVSRCAGTGAVARPVGKCEARHTASAATVEWPNGFISACCSVIERPGRKTAAFGERTAERAGMEGWHMIRALLTIAVLGSVVGFAGPAMAQDKQSAGSGSDVSSLVAKLEAQCAHRRRTMPPDAGDECARKLREAQLGTGASGAANGGGQASGAGIGLGAGPGNAGGNGIGPGSGGGLAKGKK
jgi:hypothetical protein